LGGNRTAIHFGFSGDLSRKQPPNPQPDNHFLEAKCRPKNTGFPLPKIRGSPYVFYEGAYGN